MSLETANISTSNAGGPVEQIRRDSQRLLHSTTARCKTSKTLDAFCEICKQLTLQYLETTDGQGIPCPPGLSIPTNHVRRNVQHCPMCCLLARYCFARYGEQLSSCYLQSSVDFQSESDLMRRLAPNERLEVSIVADAGGERSRRRLSVNMLPDSGEYAFDDIGPTFNIFPVESNKSQRSVFNYRLIDPHRTGLSVVGLWLAHCEKKHKNSYDNIQWIHPNGDEVFWTIDVRNKKLRRTRTKDRFVALSYVLGGTTVAPFVATAEEFFTVVDKGMSLQPMLEKQPKIIADAVLMVLDIGESLLWVDALCMPPSSKHRAAQIAFMDQICGSAVLTIIAPNEDHRGSGFSGIRWCSREPDQIAEQVGPSLTLAIELPHTIDVVTKAPWNNRGWTYQERLLSKRLLIFTDEAIFSQCKSVLTDEDVLADENESKISWPGSELSLDRMTSTESAQYMRQFRMQGDELFDDSCFGEYAAMVEGYSKRHLTLDSDVLATFSGLSRGFAWAWRTDLLWGLPESRIDAALLWEKDFLSDRNPHFHRRRPTSVRFPSWTWAGWKGAVKYQPGTCDSTKVEYARPCVGWFALKNGKLSLLGPACSFRMSLDTIEDPSSQIHHDLEAENVRLKAFSVAHQVPTDFCFTNRMLYGYTSMAPIVHFIDYLAEPTRLHLAGVSRNIGRTKGHKLGKFIQFRNHKQEVTGGAELNVDGLYEADEIDLILLSERRRIDKLKGTDLSLGYKVMLVKWDSNGRTATRVGLGSVDQRVWWNASPSWREIVLT
jgi:hypothetical protein